MGTEKQIKVLIVDDNAQYRDAFKRTLIVENYDVCEAADGDEAMDVIQKHAPDVVVTDLQMRTEREGLELIETIKAADPLIPVIMISAVGSFEEGAMATKLGASYVIHKSRIEEEMENFFDTIGQSHRDSRKNRKWLALIASARQNKELEHGSEQIEAIRKLLGDPGADAYVKGEAYDFIISVSERDLLSESELNMQQASDSDQSGEIYAAALAKLKNCIPALNSLKEDSRKALTTAEYLYGLQEEREMLDFSRTIGFSYSFAVENEVRSRLKGKLTRLASNAGHRQLIRNCIDSKTNRVDICFQRELLLTTRNRGIHFTIDNVQHVLRGMLQRGNKFKADGLKDVGIIMLCFGRKYSLNKWGQILTVNNPLKIKGLANDREVIELAGRLIALQYARNPYVHSDLEKMEKLSMLRDTAFECLNGISKLF